MGVMAMGAIAFATPAQAHDDRDRDWRSDRDFHARHHHHHWRHGRDTIVIERETPTYGYVNDSGVTVAFGGHARRHHHHFYHR